jgi:phage terminase large subunit
MSEQTLQIKASYNPKFEPFFISEKFYKVLYGSAGSGKSYAVAQKIVRRCLEEEGHRIWCFRKVSTYVDASVYDTIKSVIKEFGVDSFVTFNKTQKTITFPHTDCVIRCAGLDDQEKIKSITRITVAWLEETTEFDEQDVNQLSLRMRGHFPYHRELIMTFNPVTELHWIKKKFFDEVNEGVRTKLFTLHSTFHDNMFLGQDYIDRLENDFAHDPNNYRIYVLGQWGKVVTGMEYYKNFSRDIHVKPVSLIAGLPCHITFDFNVVPYITSSVWQIEGVKPEQLPAEYQAKYAKHRMVWYVRALKEIALKHPRNSTEDICIEYLENQMQYLEKGVVLYGDATGRNRKTSSKKTDWMIIEEMFRPYTIDMRVPRANPLQEPRHSFINRIFYGSFPIIVEIDPGCKLLIEDLTHCLEDGERKKLKTRVTDPVSKVKVEKFGHLTDGMDYLFCAAFKNMMV